jgi:hypothetical protein
LISQSHLDDLGAGAAFTCTGYAKGVVIKSISPKGAQ